MVEQAPVGVKVSPAIAIPLIFQHKEVTLKSASNFPSVK